MKKKRDILFAVTLVLVVVFATGMLVLYFVGVPKKTNIAVASTCIALSFVLLMEIIYGAHAASREKKDAAFEAYLRSKAQQADGENSDGEEDSNQMSEIDRRIDDLQAKLDKLMEQKSKNKK